MTPDEIDLARAKDMLRHEVNPVSPIMGKHHIDTLWAVLTDVEKERRLGIARVIREGDERRGVGGGA